MKILLALIVGLTLLLAQPISLPTVNQSTINMDITSNILKISGYEGRYTILEFFGKKCPVCNLQTPSLVELNKQDDIQVFAVHMQDGLDDSSLNSFLDSKGITYPVVNYNQSYALYAFAKGIVPEWQLQIPLMIFLDKDGTAISYTMGSNSKEQILDAFKTYSRN